MLLLTQALNNLGPRQERIKLPKYKGDTDVELFLQQFHDICEENDWGAGTSLLQLRGALEGPAVECGRGDTVAEIERHLRASFGMTMRQARDKLANMRRAPGQSVHNLGVDNENLVRIGYPNMAPADRTDIAVETIKRALDHKGLARHLLSLRVGTVAEVVTAAEEYFQVGGGPTQMNRHPVSAINEQADLTASVDVEGKTSTLNKLMSTMEKTCELLNTFMQGQMVANTSTPNPGASGVAGNWRTANRPADNDNRRTEANSCFFCGERGHFKRNCPKRKALNFPDSQ